MLLDNTPIFNTLSDYLLHHPIRMHVPFHNGIANNNIFPPEMYKLDISEVSGYDIEGKENPIYQSEKITAGFFNVMHTFYLTGGASSGLVASIIALSKFGKKVLLPRNVHKSVVNGIVLSGLEPVWVEVDFLDKWGIFSRINPASIEKLILKNKDIAGCVIVSPTYEGIISDIPQIAKICHSKNIPLIVDEAHGAHLYFLDDISMSFPPPAFAEGKLQQESSKLPLALKSGFPVKPGMTYGSYLSALQCGADVVVQSWHKSLGSLTQTGVLHLVNENFFAYNDIKRSLDLINSTSPSFLLLLSLELTRKYLVETKGLFLRDLLKQAILFKNGIKKLANVICFDNDDVFKIYLKHRLMSGVNYAYELYKSYSIEVESANHIGLLMTVGFGFNGGVRLKVLNAISKMSFKKTKTNYSDDMFKLHIPEVKINPRKAFLLGFKNTKEKKFESEIKAPCPPGYVISLPGTKKIEN